MTPNEYVKECLVRYPSLYDCRFAVLASLFDDRTEDAWQKDGTFTPDWIMDHRLKTLDEAMQANIKELEARIKDREQEEEKYGNTVCPHFRIQHIAALQQYQFTMKHIDIFSAEDAFYGSGDDFRVKHNQVSKWLRYPPDVDTNCLSNIPDNVSEEWKEAIYDFIMGFNYIINCMYRCRANLPEDVCQLLAMFQGVLSKVKTEKKVKATKEFRDTIKRILEEAEGF